MEVGDLFYMRKFEVKKMEKDVKNSLEIRLIQNKTEYYEALSVRKDVFVNEQKVPMHVEFDGRDKQAKHAIIKLNNKIIASARIRPLNGKLKLERIAILKQYRQQRFGNRMIKFLISYCKQRSVDEIVLHAQYHLIGFYKRFGFQTRGITFIEAGIKHIEMFMMLRECAS